MTSSLPALTRTPLGEVPFLLSGLRRGRLGLYNLAMPIIELDESNPVDPETFNAALGAAMPLLDPAIANRICRAHGPRDGCLWTFREERGRCLEPLRKDLYFFSVGEDTVCLQVPFEVDPWGRPGWFRVLPSRFRSPHEARLILDREPCWPLGVGPSPMFLHWLGPTLGLPPVPLEVFGEEGRLWRTRVEKAGLESTLAAAPVSGHQASRRSMRL